MNKNDRQLLLYEEIMLLALRDEQGTCASGYVEHLASGAILADLLLSGRIAVEDSKKKLVSVREASPLGDSLIDACLQTIVDSGKQKSLQDWVSKFAATKDLRHRIALQLCASGILRADEDKILFLFTRRIYPEINPEPEQRIIDRLREAIFTDEGEVDPRTTVLVSLASGGDLLAQAFDRKELKNRKQRIEQIVAGELAGKAAKEVIEACEMAIVLATIVPSMMPTIINP